MLEPTTCRTAEAAAEAAAKIAALEVGMHAQPALVVIGHDTI